MFACCRVSCQPTMEWANYFKEAAYRIIRVVFPRMARGRRQGTNGGFAHKWELTHVIHCDGNKIGYTGSGLGRQVGRWWELVETLLIVSFPQRNKKWSVQLSQESGEGALRPDKKAANGLEKHQTEVGRLQIKSAGLCKEIGFSVITRLWAESEQNAGFNPGVTGPLHRTKQQRSEGVKCACSRLNSAIDSSSEAG